MKIIEGCKYNRNIVAALHDAVMAALSFLLAVYIRLGPDQIANANDYLSHGMIVFTIICVIIFSGMRLYRGLWRYASLQDMVSIAKAVTLSVLIFTVVMFAFTRLDNVPRSVLFINWMLLLGMLAAPRFFYRAIKDRTLFWEMTLDEKAKIPVLLIGGTKLAGQFIQDMSRDSRTNYHVVGIIDDDPAQKNRTLQRVPIYGGVDILDIVIKKMDRKHLRPQKILIADEKFVGEKLQHIVAIADQFAIPVARIPRLSELKQHFDAKIDVLPIALEDLLGRAQNRLDRRAMRTLIENKRVLITGAGGSIGGELTRQIAAYNPRELILIENNEYHLYLIQHEMLEDHAAINIKIFLCDVRDRQHVDQIFSLSSPDLVFHAAAVKHVPIAEVNPEETILTNVFGTKNIADACIAHKVGSMVMISTDKAVNPTNIMGTTKRLAESYCQSLGLSSGHTRFITVRFGNVLGSTGSVVPLFKKQMEKGGPLTVTHPDITRYFMTIREAVELVLQAASIAGDMQDKREHIFVLDMGSPVKIVDLAKQMIKLAGLKPDEDITIEFTGLRPGEKLYEELFHDAENMQKTVHESIFLASPRVCELKSLQDALNLLYTACTRRETAQAVALLSSLVPEYLTSNVA